jgi:hypothetical protein
MASGHVNRVNRPNTWLHRPMLQNVKKILANPEPSTHIALSSENLFMHGRSGGAAMNSGENYPAKLEDGWLVGHPTGHGFDLALLQDMRRRVVEGKLDNVHAIIITRDGVLVYEQYAAG